LFDVHDGEFVSFRQINALATLLHWGNPASVQAVLPPFWAQLSINVAHDEPEKFSVHLHD